MMFPTLKNEKKGTYTLPPLDAGLNASTAPYLIEDNQLSDANNMWWEQNCLCTRPGAKTVGRADPDYAGPHKPRWQVVHTGFKMGNGNTLSELVYSHVVVDTPQEQSCSIQFYKLAGDGYIFPITQLKFSGFPAEDSSFVHTDRYPRSIFLFTDTPKNGSGVYILCLNDRFMEENAPQSSDWYTIYEFSKNMNELIQVPKTEIYAPTVLVNGRGTRAAEASLPQSVYPLPQAFESPNLLTGQFCMLFTTDGFSDQFHFPYEGLTEDGTTKVTLTNNDGSTTVFTVAGNAEQSGVVNGVYVTLNRQAGILRFFKKEGEAYAPPLSQKGNNLHIATWKTAANPNTALRYMYCGKWIDDSPGLTKGGNRLVLGNNPVYPELMAISGANRPMYFPEENLLHVGESKQSITGFAKQANRLVVFKNRSIYAVDYSNAPAYSLEDACAGRISKAKSDPERMTVFQVHGTIGCDCPATVQTCYERLVWVNTDHRVYVLVTSQGFAAAHIYELSEMIRERLLQVPDMQLRNAFAINWRGKYILFAGGRQYVLNYGKQGFRYINSYASEQSAQKNISWYVWDLHPFAGFAEAEFAGGFFHADQCVLLAALQGDTADGRRVCRLQPVCLQGQTDTQIGWDPQTEEFSFVETDIAGYFQTKCYDLSPQMRYKQVEQVFIGGAGRSPLRVTFCTEQGNGPCQPYLFTEQVRVGRLWPRLGKLQQFGLRVSCEGAYRVNMLKVQYRLLDTYK